MDIGNIVLGAHKIADLRVIIFSAGKTASSTLKKSFNAIVPTLHTHTNNLKKNHRILYRQNDITVDNIIDYHFGLHNELLLVSCYREPVSRKISSFFQNIDSHVGKNLNQMNVQQLVGIFLGKFVNLETYWPFVEDIYPPFSKKPHKYMYCDRVRIGDQEFDKNKGYTVYERDKAKLLMLRFDKINDFEDIIKSNTSYTNFKLIADNISEKKWYGGLYEEFKKALIIPKNMLDDVYEYSPENIFLEYFYDADDIRKIKEQYYIKT